MKYFKNSISLLAALTIAAIVLTSSCKKNDEVSGTCAGKGLRTNGEPSKHPNGLWSLLTPTIAVRPNKKSSPPRDHHKKSNPELNSQLNNIAAQSWVERIFGSSSNYTSTMVFA